MAYKRSQNLLVLALIAAACPAWAGHGAPASTDRDAWINDSLRRLIADGVIPAPAEPIEKADNAKAAQMAAKAAEIIVAQADLGNPPVYQPGPALPPQPESITGPLAGPRATPPPESIVGPLAGEDAMDAGKLVEEYGDQLTAMGADLPKLEDRIYQIRHRDEGYAELQKKYLKRTGTELTGYSRGYFYNFRGFGSNAIYPPMDFNDVIFMEARLKSVPVPGILFDARIRFWRTIGLYYADPIQPDVIDLRWISLSNFNPYCTITAGDFFQHYTPLTLWNSEIPVYTFVEPTSYYRNRKDVEELVFMDHGPDWRLRGFQAATTLAGADVQGFSDAKLQAMAGPLKQATQFGFGDYFAGSQVSAAFLNDNLEFKGAGLLIWDDSNTANVPYLPTFPSTFAKQYQVGSLSLGWKIPFTADISLNGTGEYAGSTYQDDLNNPDRTFSDWAVFGTGSLNIYGLHLTTKYYNIGPYYYSPGAQTNRYTPGTGSTSYLNTNNFGEDDFLQGYLNRYPFQSASRPFFAPYDRMSENILPYGDSTPNRMGFVESLELNVGQNGFLKLQGSGDIQMKEIQPNYVLNNAGTGIIPVDSTTVTTVARAFTGYEGALTVDFAKAFDMKDKIYQVAVDGKYQSTDLGVGNDFNVLSLIGSLDFNVPIPGFDSVVLSCAYEWAKSAGDEYVLSGMGSPGSYANYPFFLDSTSIGAYAYTPLNITRNSMAFGFMYPLSKTINFRGDYFINQYSWTDAPLFDRRDQIWRFTYEAWF